MSPNFALPRIHSTVLFDTRMIVPSFTCLSFAFAGFFVGFNEIGSFQVYAQMMLASLPGVVSIRNQRILLALSLASS